MRRLALMAVLLAACHGRDDAAGRARIRLWHTFSPAETEALNEVIASREGGGDVEVEVTMLSFARGQVVLRDIFEEGKGCPDVVRIDATWLPGLAPFLLPAGNAAADRRWLPEAEELASYEGVRYGLPQSLDGLALIARRSVVAGRPDWPPASVEKLESLAAGLRRGGHEWGIDLRVDAYWFVPFLRAGGADVLDPKTGKLGIDRPEAAAALADFAALFRRLAPPPAASGDAFREEVRRFTDDQVALVIEGPWAVGALAPGDQGSLAAAPFPGKAAPLGGQLFVVPRCARHPVDGWALARDLTDPAVQADWGVRFGVIPAAADALPGAGALAGELYRAIEGTRPLPRHPVSPELFDDLTPAVAAVVAGDATSYEALAGVARAWTRLRRRHHIPAPAAP